MKAIDQDLRPAPKKSTFSTLPRCRCPPDLGSRRLNHSGMLTCRGQCASAKHLAWRDDDAESCAIARTAGTRARVHGTAASALAPPTTTSPCSARRTPLHPHSWSPTTAGISAAKCRQTERSSFGRGICRSMITAAAPCSYPGTTTA